ncbi:MAG: thioredoxin, partial [Gemmatimonadota bacterium]|nr:thioredoxin [Gemmatimonadota bacterium]
VTTTDSQGSVMLRCSFCEALNQLQLDSLGDRLECGECARRILIDRPVKISQDDFETTVLSAGVPVLVDFYADWCAPCKMVAPMLDEIAREQIGNMLVTKVDTDAAPDIAMTYEIRSIPTLIIFRGGEEIARSVGFEPELVRDLVERVVA